MNTPPTNDYFADIGFWPRGTGFVHYAAGLVLALVLTLVPFALVELQASHHAAFSHAYLVAAVVVCALLQFVVQVAFFLHLAGRGVARERLVIFAGACLVVGILVAGSLWIMLDLNARMMTPPSAVQMEQYMQAQGGF